MRPTTVIPVHYEGWSHFRQGRPAIERQLVSASPEIRAAFEWATIGEPLDVRV